MRSFRVVFLFISMAFVVASCGSSSSISTTAITGEVLPGKVAVLNPPSGPLASRRIDHAARERVLLLS